MDGQGAQEDPEESPGRPRSLETTMGIPSNYSISSWSSWPSFWLLLGSQAILQAVLILQPAVGPSPEALKSLIRPLRAL